MAYFWKMEGLNRRNESWRLALKYEAKFKGQSDNLALLKPSTSRDRRLGLSLLRGRLHEGHAGVKCNSYIKIPRENRLWVGKIESYWQMNLKRLHNPFYTPQLNIDSISWFLMIIKCYVSG